MKKLLMTSLVAFAMLTTSSAIVHAYPQGKGKCVKCAMKAEKCKITKLKKKIKSLKMHQEHLNITEDQWAKIKTIKHTAIKDIIRLKADKEIIAVDIKSAMHEKKIDASAVNRLIDSKYAAKAKIAKAYVKALADVQGVLTDEQLSQWKEMGEMGKDCKKCMMKKDGKFCPITGKPMMDKGSMK